MFHHLPVPPSLLGFTVTGESLGRNTIKTVSQPVLFNGALEMVLQFARSSSDPCNWQRVWWAYLSQWVSDFPVTGSEGKVCPQNNLDELFDIKDVVLFSLTNLSLELGAGLFVSDYWEPRSDHPEQLHLMNLHGFMEFWSSVSKLGYCSLQGPFLSAQI